MALVLFDGECGLCNQSVQFIVNRDHRSHFSFESLSAPQVRENLPAELRGTDSIIVAENGRYYIKSRAAFKIAKHLRWPWPLLGVFRIVPTSIADKVYDIVAKHRHRLSASAARLSSSIRSSK